MKILTWLLGSLKINSKYFILLLALYKSGKNKGRDRKRSILQGNRIEHPDFIHSNKLELDYSFYITNQIMNPVKQVFDLEMDEKETELIFLK